MSEFIKGLRSKIGHGLLQVPTAGVLIFDADRRVLLVRHSEGNLWTSPGGMVEPYETPADAAVREMWEETGLLVELVRVLGVFGGLEFSTTYANGDQISWVSTVFEGRTRSGTMRPDGMEILETRYFHEEEVQTLRCKPRLRTVLSVAFGTCSETYFQPPTWSPDRCV